MMRVLCVGAMVRVAAVVENGILVHIVHLLCGTAERAAITITTIVGEAMILELSPDEAAEMFSDICLRELGITGREFLARWDSGRYSGCMDDSLIEVWKVMSLVRWEKSW